MEKEQLERLKEVLNTLIYQMDNHQQARKSIADPNGLGRLNLLLDNARIPKQYYDIFYNMLCVDVLNFEKGQKIDSTCRGRYANILQYVLIVEVKVIFLSPIFI